MHIYALWIEPPAHYAVYMDAHVELVFNGIIIREYGSTLYIGIAMVVLPYIGPWEN